MKSLMRVTHTILSQHPVRKALEQFRDNYFNIYKLFMQRHGDIQHKGPQKEQGIKYVEEKTKAEKYHQDIYHRCCNKTFSLPGDTLTSFQQL